MSGDNGRRMEAARFAPRRQDGLCPYVVETRESGRTYTRIEWAPSLRAAKGRLGSGRRGLTRVCIRRALVGELLTTRGGTDGS
jgi:hypothetical protein